MNSLLKRQLKKHLGDIAVPPELQRFLTAVDLAYTQFDEDRRMLERSLELSSSELVQANSQMRAVFDAFPDLFFRLDQDGKILEHKNGSLTNASVPAVERAGMRIQNIFPKETGAQFDDAIQKLRASHQPVSIEYSLPVGSGLEYYEARLLPLPGEEIIVIVRDITIRKIAEAELLKSQLLLEEKVEARTRELRNTNESLTLFQAAVQQANESIMITDGELNQPGPRILYVNPAFTLMSGYETEEALGKTPRMLQGPKSNRGVMADLRRKLEEGKPFHGQTINYRKDGAEYVVDWRIAPIRDANGVTTHYVSVQRDITQQKLEENSLKESEERFRTFMNNLPGIAFLKDDGGRYVWVNDPLERAFGLGSGEWLGKTDFDHWPAEVARELRKNDQQALAGEETAPVYESYPSKTGGRDWFMLKFPFSDSSGRRLLGGTGIEITELKRTENALKASEERFRTLSESAPVGIFETDQAGFCVYVNAKWLQLTGLTSEEVGGARWTEAIHPEDKEFVATSWHAFTETGGQFCNEFRFQTRPGFIRWVQVRATPLVFGEITRGYVGTVVDITERKQFELDLARARDQAVAATGQKARFLATMSHEIRTPMNGIIGMTGILMDTPLSGQQREFANTIRDSGELLLTIVNDILDFSKIEAGKLSFETSDIDLEEVAEGSLELMAERAQAKGIELSCYVEPNVNLALRGDAGRIKQILTNLLGNALKFTERGAVVLRVSEQEVSGDNTVLLRFEIEDTGIGISQQAQARLFQPFSQADNSTTRKYGGTGLGLAICAQLVSLMDGNIGVESTPGIGSTFWFTLRLEAQKERRTAQEVSDEGHPLRVLVASNNHHTRRALIQQIVRWNMVFSAASTREEALRLLKDASPDEPYDVVLLDFMPPETSSVDFAKTLKSDPSFATPRIILLTPLKEQVSANDLDLAGIETRLIKPVKRGVLLETLHRPRRLAAATAARVSPCVSADLMPLFGRSKTKLRILLAEDNVVNQFVAVAQLRKMGLTADCVASGTEVLQALTQIPYNLILMDCQMPEMDGLEATRQIRQIHAGQPIYIVAMTANAMKEDRDNCIEAGMDDYLSKPVQLSSFREALDRGVKRLSEWTANSNQSSPNRLGAQGN